MEIHDIAQLSKGERIEMTQCRALFYSLVTIPFTALPDNKFIKRIRSEDFISILEGISNQDFHVDIVNGSALMLNFIKSTINFEDAELEQILGLDRTYLYRGIAPDVGPPPPYEAVWNSAINDSGELISNLEKLYRVSGFELSDNIRERLDYIGVELDYLLRLVLLEEEMLVKGDEINSELNLQQAYFYNEHINKWAPSFIEKALPMVKTDFYRGHLIMLRGQISEENKYFQGLPK